jgi:hypothetical protein
VLAVVQHQQQLFVAQELHQHHHRRPTGVIPDAQRVSDRLDQELVILQRGQLHQPHPAGKSVLQVRGHPQGQPGLTDPGPAGQGDKPMPPHQPRGMGDLTPTTDEAGDLGGQVAHQPT